MPSKRRRDGSFKDTAFPLNNEVRAALERRVLLAYEEATGRGNPLIAKTKTAQFIHGKKLSEFPPEKSDELGALNDHFNKLLEAVGAAK